jgi:hypothetical protein
MASAPKQQIPFLRRWPLLVGVLTGIVMRIGFSGVAGSAFSAMSAAFIYIAPVLVGVVTAYCAERIERRTLSYHFTAGVFANAFFVLGTLLILIEGLLCSVLIIPLFAVFGGFAAVIMGFICHKTNWPKQALRCVAIAPFLVLAVEALVPLSPDYASAEHTVSIRASDEKVWNQILHTSVIEATEVKPSLLHTIGVPLPQSGALRETDKGLARRVTMGKDIYFDEVITRLDKNRSLQWKYKFYPDSFPPYALDDHVVVGGQSFDVIATEYTLTPRGEFVDLAVRMDYRVSTRFNWYAAPLAQWLMNDLAKTNVLFYKQRSERQSL